jgi:hypothetical protein
MKAPTVSESISNSPTILPASRIRTTSSERVWIEQARYSSRPRAHPRRSGYAHLRPPRRRRPPRSTVSPRLQSTEVGRVLLETLAFSTDFTEVRGETVWKIGISTEMGVPKALEWGQRSRDRPLLAAEEARSRGLKLFSKQFRKEYSPKFARELITSSYERCAYRQRGGCSKRRDSITGSALSDSSGKASRKGEDLCR